VENRIGIAGYTGSGKTTAANHLVSKGYRLLGFATPLYKLADIHSTPEIEWHSRVWGWTEDWLKPAGYNANQISWFAWEALKFMDKIEVVEGKNRTLLQKLGTEVGRAMDENIWTGIFEATVEKDPKAKIANDNLRFPNEMDNLVDLDFFTVFLDVPIEVRMERYEQEYGVRPTEEQLSHESEKHLPEIREKSDLIYDNTQGKERLYTMLDNVVKGHALLTR